MVHSSLLQATRLMCLLAPCKPISAGLVLNGTLVGQILAYKGKGGKMSKAGRKGNKGKAPETKKSK